MNTWIVVGVAVLALGTIAGGLLRMRDWLKRSPPLPPPIELPGDKEDQ